MAEEGGVGGGRRKAQNEVGMGGVGGMKVWRNAYGGESGVLHSLILRLLERSCTAFLG